MPIQMIRTRERIIQIAREFGMSEGRFIATVKARKVNGAFNPALWDKYMEIITGYIGCPICGGPSIIDRSLARQYGSPRGLRCRDDRGHFFLEVIAKRIALDSDLEYEKALQKVREWKEVVHDNDSGVNRSRFKDEISAESQSNRQINP